MTRAPGPIAADRLCAPRIVMTSYPSFVKAPIVKALDQGLNGDVAQELPANADLRIGQSIKGVVDDGITEGTRSAATAAGIFVLLGALSSLLIPNAKSGAWEPTSAQRERESISVPAE